MGDGYDIRHGKQPSVIARSPCDEAIQNPRRSTGLLRRFAPRNDNYPPRIGGITTCSRRQARRSISSQARNWRSLLMQIRTSLRRLWSQITATAALLKPGLALMKAPSTSAGATVFGSERSRKSGGILTAARALLTVSK